MLGKKDEFWKYAKFQDKGFLCKFCEHHFRGSVSVARLKTHLAGETGRNTKICAKVPNDVKSAALQAIHASRKKDKSTRSSNNVEEHAIIPNSSSSIVKECQHSTMPNICEKKDVNLINRKLGEFITSNGHWFDSIRTQGFVHFAKNLAEFGLSCEQPNCSTSQIKSISDFENEVQEYKAEVKKFIPETGCTLIVDKWVDISDIYMNIFICTPRGLVLDNSFQNSYGTLTFPYQLHTINPRHVIQCFHEVYYDSFVFPVVLCPYASLEIERLLLSICDNEWINNIFWLARWIVKYIKGQDLNLLSRRDNHRSKKYAGSYLNKHACSFLMLQSILKDENELKALQPSSTEYTFDLYNRIIGCSEFWRVGKEVVQVVETFFQVLNLVDGYMSTSGYLFEAFGRAKDKIEKCINKNQEKYVLIWKAFEYYYTEAIQPIHKAAALLNPDYKLSEDLKDNEIEEGVDYLLNYLVSLGEKDVFRAQIESYRTHLRPLILRKAIKVDVHPRIWWEKYGDSFPVLRKYAIQILSQPCSLLLCHEYRLKKTSSSYNYELGVNAMLMEIYNKLEAEEKPIDLEKVSAVPEYADLDLDFESWKDEEFDMEEEHYECIMNILNSAS